MTTTQRPVGILIALLGAAGAVVSALADPLDIGEGHTFGWLQILGLVLGIVAFLVGLALAADRVPMRRRDATAVATGTQNTTIVEDPGSTPSRTP